MPVSYYDYELIRDKVIKSGNLTMIIFTIAMHFITYRKCSLHLQFLYLNFLF
jgi:hypothetical protein